MKAIHDRYYSTAPDTFTDLRWRLQHIAEDEIGRRTRWEAAADESAAAQLRDEINGTG